MRKLPHRTVGQLEWELRRSYRVSVA